MSRYVIAVGGTGQHIALALTRLVYSRALKRDIRLIALDPDTETPLPQLLQAPTPSLGGAAHPLGDGTVRAPFDIAKLGKRSFEQIFVDADHPAEKEIFEALFDDTEASIPVHQGMHGTPCVGATVFGEGANSALLQNLLKPLSTATQVFVCGSIVGGTGAGILHKLVLEIKKNTRPPHEIYGIFMLPWFAITSQGGEGAISDGTIARNATHGIKFFYEHTLHELKASVLIGCPAATQTKVLRRPVREGMGETPSFLHLVAARALIDLPQEATAHDKVKAYGVLHSLTQEGWLLDLPWEETRYPLRQHFRALRVQENLLRFFVHPANRKKILDSCTPFRMETGSAWKPFVKSIEQNAPDKKLRRSFAEAALERFEAIWKEVSFCVEWAHGLFPGELLDMKNDLLMRELSEAVQRGAESPVHWERLRAMWTGRELAADPSNASKPRTGAEVAQHLSDQIFNAALEQTAG